VNDNELFIREELKNGTVNVVIKPVDIGRLVGSKLQGLPTVILTSATLQAQLIAQELGIKASVVVDEPSPFDFKSNSLVYAPKNAPNPTVLNQEGKHDVWVQKIAKEVVQLVTASGGNAMVLFTSLREMDEVYDYILQEYDWDWPTMIQLDGRKADDMLAEYMDTDNAVIFGSKSFFEGVDIKGVKLRLVILTKLPFPMWGDSIVKAKREMMGRDFFQRYYLLHMYTDLTQAAGRLIRTKEDRGVFAVLDARMWVGGNKRIDPEKVKSMGGKWPGYGYTAYEQLPFEHITPFFHQAEQLLRHIRKQEEKRKLST
jgi:ATP-dependent DNA helicase DinG